MVWSNSTAISNDYGIESYFGFSRTPFANTTDLSFYYPAPTQVRLLKKILQQYETDFVRTLVVGKRGVGKKTLASRLSSILTLHGKVEPKIIIPQSLGPAGSLKGFLEDVEIPWQDNFDESLKALKEYLITRFIKNNPLFLIIKGNNAKLSDDSIAILSELVELKFDGQSVFHFIWFTDEEPDNIATHISQFIKDYELLNDLPYFEMTEMINFRCHVAGRSQPLFTSAAYNAIFDHTNGNPEMTLRLCQFALDEARIQMKPFCDFEEIDAAWSRWFMKNLNIE